MDGLEGFEGTIRDFGLSMGALNGALANVSIDFAVYATLEMMHGGVVSPGPCEARLRSIIKDVRNMQAVEGQQTGDKLQLLALEQLHHRLFGERGEKLPSLRLKVRRSLNQKRRKARP